MASITTIASGDLITNSRAVINDNFTNLNTDKIETSYIDTDTTLAANSDVKIATQKAVKAYVDTQGGANGSETVRGVVEEATDAEVTAGTATGGTGAKLFVTPAKLATRLSTAVIYKNGTATKDITEASTTQTIAHGLGVTPKSIRFTLAVKVATDPFQICKGSYDSGSQNFLLASGDSFVSTGSGAVLKIYENSTNSGTDTQTGVVTVDSTNITITWTRSGIMSNAGTATFLWEAQG